MALTWKMRREAMREVAKTVRRIHVPPPPKPRRGFLRDYVFNSQNFFSTLSIFGLIALIVFSPGNIEIFDPIKYALSDFEFKDVEFGSHSEDFPVDQDIALVNIGRNRAEIAYQIKVLSAMQPKVVAVDVLFASEKEADMDLPLMEALSSTKNVVLTSKISGFVKDTSKPQYTELRMPHEKFRLPNVSFGHDAFIPDEENRSLQTIRLVELTVPYKDTTLNSFALEVAERYKPGIAKRVKERENETEIINFKGNYNKFVMLDIEPGMPIDSAVSMYGSLVRDKIVILTYMGQPFDNPNDIRGKLYTPAAKVFIGKSAPDMYTGVIQANTISMLIHDQMIEKMPEWMEFAIAVIICYFNMALFHWITARFPSFAGGEMKLIQLIQSGMITLGAMYSFYLINYSFQTGLMLAVVLLASDVLEIHESSIKRLIERIRETTR
ncbi:MAG: CHASE2 domain-containing protein [Candidatus Kapaibacterium sp.]|nr:MAG: CHASE2 domain-containing protein [Candidatus Kapabacteria bacterium]